MSIPVTMPSWRRMRIISACGLLLGVALACGDARVDLITRRPTTGSCLLNADCAGTDHPICDVLAGRCVECLTDGHCNSVVDRCSTALGICAPPCSAVVACPLGDESICDTAVGFCVECRIDADCPDAEDPLCRGSVCTN